MVVRKGLDYYITCALRNTRIVQTENGFRGVPVAVADRGKRSDQSTTSTMSSGTSVLSPFNTEQRTLAAFPKTRIQKTSFKYWHRHVACRCHLRFISTLVSTLRDLLNLHLADPKVDEFPFSIQSTSLYALLKSICYAFVQLCSFGRSLSIRLAGRVINHFCPRYAILFQYCHLLELYVKCAALKRTFISQSFCNMRCGRPRGRKFHLTRSLVAFGGWSSVRDHKNRKHCPSHEIMVV